MIDTFQLSSAISSLLTTNFPAIVNGLDHIPETTSFPYIRFSYLPDTIYRGYAVNQVVTLISEVDIQFSSFSTTLSVASGLQRAIGLSFDRKKLVLPTVVDEFVEENTWQEFTDSDWNFFTDMEWSGFLSEIGASSPVFMSAQIIDGSQMLVERWTAGLVYHGIVVIKFRIFS